ncbi:MAG: hypothetical protein OXC07_03780, partial [Kistimonas sp.]|nr:hypothetical protein [Kistimonas sp.]
MFVLGCPGPLTQLWLFSFPLFGRCSARASFRTSGQAQLTGPLAQSGEDGRAPGLNTQVAVAQGVRAPGGCTQHFDLRSSGGQGWRAGFPV